MLTTSRPDEIVRPRFSPRTITQTEGPRLTYSHVIDDEDPLVAIDAPIAKHGMPRYSTHSRSLGHRAAALPGNREAAQNTPAHKCELGAPNLNVPPPQHRRWSIRHGECR